jgi:hypothetical protein
VLEQLAPWLDRLTPAWALAATKVQARAEFDGNAALQIDARS